MKWGIFISVLGLGLFLMTGCYTIPRHYDNNSDIVNYEPLPETQIIVVTPPLPPPPILIGMPAANPNQSSGRQQDLLNNNGSSYGNRDHLQGSDKRGRIDPKTTPPVRNPEQKDRGQE